MNLILTILLSFFPVNTSGVNNTSTFETSVSVSYSSLGLLSTNVQRQLINSKGLKVSLGLNTIRFLKEHKALSFSTISLKYERSVSTNFSFSFEGFFNLPLNDNYKFLTGGIKP